MWTRPKAEVSGKAEFGSEGNEPADQIRLRKGFVAEDVKGIPPFGSTVEEEKI